MIIRYHDRERSVAGSDPVFWIATLAYARSQRRTSIVINTGDYTGHGNTFNFWDKTDSYHHAHKKNKIIGLKFIYQFNMHRNTILYTELNQVLYQGRFLILVLNHALLPVIQEILMIIPFDF
jgi:hypothetical protein